MQGYREEERMTERKETMRSRREMKNEKIAMGRRTEIQRIKKHF